MLSLNDTVDRLKKSENLDELFKVMRFTFEDLGFPEWGYLCQLLNSYAKSTLFLFINMSQDWIQHYFEMNYYDTDPITKYYIQNNLPLIWKANDDWSEHGDNVVEFMKDVQDHGYTGGLCIPLFSAQNTRGLVDLVSRDPSLADIYDAIEGRAAQIVLITRYVQEEIFRISGISEEGIYKNPLSTRQKEVLFWVGEGLTSKAIAEKIGISYRTVEDYLAEIQRKLCVSNRQQAVTRAVSLGYIQLMNMYTSKNDSEVTLVVPNYNL